MPPSSSNHDPILYQFFHTCGGRYTEWKGYRAQITALKPKGYRAPRQPQQAVHPSGTEIDPYPWAYPAVRVLAQYYLRETRTEADAKRAAALAYQAVIDAPSSAKRVGAQRRLHYARARWWAAVVRSWPEPRRDAYPTAPASTTVPEQARAQERRTIERARLARKYRIRKLADAEREVEFCKTTKQDLTRAYEAALMRHRRAVAKYEADLLLARMDNPEARAPKASVTAAKIALTEYRQALRDRNAVIRRLQRARLKLTKLAGSRT